ncbi:MAG: aldehyde dehydrogenase family protein, partial [Acidimicrobiales bacterium]
MWHEERLFIGGNLVPAEGGRTFETIDPTTEQQLGTAADASVGDAKRAVESARQAFDKTAWAADRELRVRCLRQLGEALVNRIEDFRQLIVCEVGAPLMLTQGPQLEAPLRMIDWYADLVEKYEFTEELGVAEALGRMSNRWIEKEAIGVVAAIVPYNYPIQISLAKLIPALAAGCTVVLKGPPQAPW